MRAWASAAPSVGSVPAPARRAARACQVPAASTIRMIELRWPENVDSDCAIVCSSPMSAKTRARSGGGCRRRPGWEAGLVHQAEQAERAQRDGLAAGVRAGHDERREAVAEAQVDRDDHSWSGPGWRADSRIHLGPLGRWPPRSPLISAARSALVHQGRTGRRVGPLARAVRDWRPRAPRARRGCGRPLPPRLPRLAPGVAELDRHEAARPEGLATAPGVVDDALDP